MSDFRAFHLKELSDLFVQVVHLAREMGLVKLGTIAVDGTKIKANASRHKAMSYERMLKAEVELTEQIKALLDKAKAADAAEKNEPELDIPAEVARRQDRLAQITAAKARLEQRQREADLQRGRDQDDERKPRDKNGKVKPGGTFKCDFGVPKDTAQENFTDADSRVMKRSGGGFDYSYNAQTAVDETAHIIVAAELTNMAAKLQTDETQTAYRKRKWIAESPNGWIKNVLGFRQFSLRGLHRVRAEFKLVCLALNLRRMNTMHGI